jgi:hypothetical protein
MVRKAKQVDASFFSAQPLFLKPCSREIYLDFIRKNFPALEKMYAQRFAANDFASRAYSKQIETMVRTVCAKHFLKRRSSDALLTRDAGEASYGVAPGGGGMLPKRG